jgi:hypothetical protein
MKMKFPVVLLCVLCASPAFARLGETEAQIEARYSKPVLVLPDDGFVKSRAYVSGGLGIVVKFEGGLSQAEMFAKGDHSEFSQHEISVLLAANKGGYNWLGSPDGLNLGERAWCSTDKRSRVAYELKRQLFITSQPFLDRVAAWDRVKEERMLKGF